MLALTIISTELYILIEINDIRGFQDRHPSSTTPRNTATLTRQYVAY
jgi:hypothetical protein